MFQKPLGLESAAGFEASQLVNKNGNAHSSSPVYT